MDAVSTLLAHALEAQGLQQRLLAENVANMDTPGYHPKTLSFQQQLARAANLPQMLAVKPQVVSSSGIYRNDGNGVDPDKTMVDLSRAAMRYATLSQLFGSRMNQLTSAISGTAQA